jgi:hypothetical protein
MVGIGEDISNAEKGGYLVLIIAGIAVIAYIGYECYELGNSLCVAFCNMFGGSDCTNSCSGSTTTGNTYSSALGQSLSDPIGTVESILGINQAPSSVESMSDISTGGTLEEASAGGGG